MNDFKFEVAEDPPVDYARIERYRRMGLSEGAARTAAGVRGHMPLSKRIVISETTKPTPKSIQETRREVKEVVVNGVKMREVRTLAADGKVLISRGPVTEADDDDASAEAIALREARYRRMGLSESAAATAARIGTGK